jgi:hypothetical protein
VCLDDLRHSLPARRSPVGDPGAGAPRPEISPYQPKAPNVEKRGTDVRAMRPRKAERIYCGRAEDKGRHGTAGHPDDGRSGPIPQGE